MNFCFIDVYFARGPVKNPFEPPCQTAQRICQKKVWSMKSRPEIFKGRFESFPKSVNFVYSSKGDVQSSGRWQSTKPQYWASTELIPGSPTEGEKNSNKNPPSHISTPFSSIKSPWALSRKVQVPTVRKYTKIWIRSDNMITQWHNTRHGITRNSVLQNYFVNWLNCQKGRKK